jgi:hypothetical protein
VNSKLSGERQCIEPMWLRDRSPITERIDDRRMHRSSSRPEGMPVDIAGAMHGQQQLGNVLHHCDNFKEATLLLRCPVPERDATLKHKKRWKDKTAGTAQCKICSGTRGQSCWQDRAHDGILIEPLLLLVFLGCVKESESRRRTPHTMHEQLHAANGRQKQGMPTTGVCGHAEVNGYQRMAERT